MSKKLKVSSKQAVKKSSASKAPAKGAAKVTKKTAGKPAPKAAATKKVAARTPVKVLAKTKKTAVAAKKAPAGKPVSKRTAPAKAAGKSKVSAPAKAIAKASVKTSTKAPVKAPVKKIAVKAVTSPVKKAPVKVEAPKAKVSAAPAKASEPLKPSPAKVAENAKKALIEQKSGEVLAINNTIPVTPKQEISQSKIASISQSITNPVRRNDSYAVKVEKEPNGKFELEFVFHASGEMLFEFVSTASGLSEWFCDDLNIRNGIYTFIWDDQLQQARLLKTIDLQLVRFQWVEKTDGSYFEFRIQRDDLTNDIALIVTDFADSNSEKESSKLLWNSQIEKLRHVLGSIF